MRYQFFSQWHWPKAATEGQKPCSGTKYKSIHHYFKNGSQIYTIIFLNVWANSGLANRVGVQNNEQVFPFCLQWYEKGNIFKNKNTQVIVCSHITKKKSSNTEKEKNIFMKDRMQEKNIDEDQRETPVLKHQKTENIIQNNCLTLRFCLPSSKH